MFMNISVKLKLD